jgi:hypothetical protein
VREGLTLVGAFPEGTTVIGSERDSVAKKKFTGAHLLVTQPHATDNVRRAFTLEPHATDNVRLAFTLGHKFGMSG